MGPAAGQSPDQQDGTPIRDRNTGKLAYTTIIEFGDRSTRDAFSAAVITAVLKLEPMALEAAA